VGSLLTWADRVLALVEAADFIEAINLTSLYYNGKSEKITLGLPENDDERHAVVRDKLTEMIIASLKYIFSHKDEREDDVHAEIAHQKLVKALTVSCIDACMSMQSPEFLFDEVYEVFEEYAQTDVFIEVLEPYILHNRLQDVPPSIMKDITTYFVNRGLHQRLEQVICHIDPGSLDIDQITSICRQHGLYDAFAYVYNTALKDYITPMVEFVRLVREFFSQDPGDEELIDHHDNKTSIAFNALKVFPYLSYILTSRTYPTGDEIPDSSAHEAKQSIYYFLFSGRTLAWPQSHGTLIRTTPETDEEPTFPYLRLFLRFDAPTLFQALDEAFEDRFLNGTESNGSSSTSFSRSINRQFIINIFLEVMARDSDIIYLYMFIARNLPKYPQFILLSGSTIEGILLHLSTYGESDMAEEAQLAAEYLLSVFKPSDSEKMIQEYMKARFWRVLKTTLRAEGRYTELLDVCLRDEDRSEVFECVDGLLRGGSAVNVKQRDAVKGFLLERLEELVRVDVPRTATLFEQYIWDKQTEVIRRLTPDRPTLFVYLDTIFTEHLNDGQSWIDKDIRELYITLMCEFRPTELTTYLDTLIMEDFRIENVLPTLEKYDVTDAIILVLRRVGMTKEAMHRVVIKMTSLRGELVKVMQRHESEERESQAEELILELHRYAFVGADLCETFSKEFTAPSKGTKGKSTVGKLNEAEQLWLSLLETTVGVTREITSTVSEGTVIDIPNDDNSISHESHTLSSLRVLIQDIFTKLLTQTSSTPSPSRRTTTQISFLSILRAFLRNLGTSPITDLRGVLSSIFDAYRYEKQLIQVTSRLIDADLFHDFLTAKKAREKGWRPTSANCLACGRVLFGPGAKGNIFSKWEKKRLALEAAKLAVDENTKKENHPSSQPITPDGKGKGKGVDPWPLPGETTNAAEDVEGDIVVFGCGHGFHRGCLAELGREQGVEMNEIGEGEGRLRCIVCEAH
jgi:vacuolar protein sorting-associated protein 8